MIGNGSNTGMALNKISLFGKVEGPNFFVPSKNSAFCVCRKRTRDEFPEEQMIYQKRHKIYEFPTFCDNYITSKSSVTSFTSKYTEDTEIIIESHQAPLEESKTENDR